jgi:hypothetical protein
MTLTYLFTWSVRRRAAQEVNEGDGFVKSGKSLNYRGFVEDSGGLKSTHGSDYGVKGTGLLDTTGFMPSGASISA